MKGITIAACRGKADWGMLLSSSGCSGLLHWFTKDLLVAIAMDQAIAAKESPCPSFVVCLEFLG